MARTEVFDAKGMDELGAEMNAEFERELAEERDNVEVVMPDRNGKGWLR